MGELTGKQQAFIEHYLGDCKYNATEAAARAGCKGNRATLQVVGVENLSKPIIKEAIAERMVEIREKTEITVAYIQAEHERLAKLAEAKGDYSTATRNKELLGKTIAAYTDNTNVTDTIKQRVLDANEKREADRIAAIAIREKLAEANTQSKAG
jgi:phage terminase small subunit